MEKPEDEKILSIEQDLENAHAKLHQTMSVVEAKVGDEVDRAENAISPRKLLRDSLVGATCIAGLFGYVVGSSKYRRIVGPVVLVALSYTIWSRSATVRSPDAPDWR